jgi:hypothetical protein
MAKPTADTPHKTQSRRFWVSFGIFNCFFTEPSRIGQFFCFRLLPPAKNERKEQKNAARKTRKHGEEKTGKGSKNALQ